MEYRRLGKTGFEVSAISLGTWQVGGRWGEPFNDALAESLIEAAIERGVTFIDTADVYSDRASEAAVGRVVRRVKERHGGACSSPPNAAVSSTRMWMRATRSRPCGPTWKPA